MRYTQPRFDKRSAPPRTEHAMTDIKEPSAPEELVPPATPGVHSIDRVVFGVAAVLATGFVLTGAGFVLFSAYLAISRYGNVKLGPDDSEPEFSTFSWVSMMFATGMGIGLMFWGVAEPLTHLNAPPMDQAGARTPQAAQLAMEYSFFHWGFHPWAMYAVIGL